MRAFRTVAEHLADNLQNALRAGQDIGYPVVLKLCGASLTHKTELGGVVLGVSSPEDLERHYEELLANADRQGLGNDIDGVLVARQMSGGVEMILGIQRDPAFGPLVMVGLGGVFAEVFKDVSFRAAPVSHDEALRMIDELGGRSLLDGVRGAKPCDVTALAHAIANIANLAASLGDEIDSLEINPLLVMPAGEGVVALDALIVRR